MDSENTSYFKRERNPLENTEANKTIYTTNNPNNKTNILNIIKQKNASKAFFNINNSESHKPNNNNTNNQSFELEPNNLNKKTTEKNNPYIINNKNTKNEINNQYNLFSKNTLNNKLNQSKNENNNEIIIVIIRHGERADLAGCEIKFDLYDPELTSKGIKQAYEAGCRLKEILDLLKPKNKKIAILTSPFSRCIMTAKYVKNGMNYNLPLFLENGLCEFVNRQWFKESPKNFLCFLKNNNLLFQELSNEIIIDNSLANLPEFPESTNKCTDRFSNAFDAVIEQYALKTGFNVVVLVTHFFGIQCLCEKMNIPLDNFDIEYCSTFVFRFNKDNKEFKFENNFYPIDEEIY